MISCPAEEHLGSDIHACVPSILGSAKPSLEMSDSTENADVFAPCIAVCCRLEVNDSKWESASVLKDAHI